MSLEQTKHSTYSQTRPKLEINTELDIGSAIRKLFSYSELRELSENYTVGFLCPKLGT
jgi:hypothetical protein